MENEDYKKLNLAIEALSAKFDSLPSKEAYWTKKVLTIDDVMAYTGLAKATIRTMTLKRIIPHSKPTARMTFFDRERIEQWMLSNPVSTQAETINEAIEYIAGKDKSKRKKHQL